jgi:hypothetical protein
VSGALANLTLSKRNEILDKSSVKDSLMKSPLTDKIFGLSLQKVQEEDNVRGGNDLGPRARFLNTLRTRLLSMRCFRRIGILFATNNLSPFCRKSRSRLITRR